VWYVNQSKVVEEVQNIVIQVWGDYEDDSYKKKEEADGNGGEDSFLAFSSSSLVCVQTIHLNSCFFALKAYNTSPCLAGGCMF